MTLAIKLAVTFLFLGVLAVVVHFSSPRHSRLEKWASKAAWWSFAVCGLGMAGAVLVAVWQQ